MTHYPNPSNQPEEHKKGQANQKDNPPEEVESIRQDEEGFPQENLIPPGNEPEKES